MHIIILKKKAKTTHEYSLSFSSSRRFSRKEQIRYTAELLVNAISIVQSQQDWWHHRRRIELEFKAKVTSVCSIPCRASCFTLDYLKKKVEFILFFLIDRGRTVSAQRNWTNFAPEMDATTFVLSSNSILLLWVAQSWNSATILVEEEWWYK